MFDERNKTKKPTTKPVTIADSGKSKGAKAEDLAKEAEEDITEQLFATDIAMDSKSLKSQANYESFARQVSEVLYAGDAPYNIPSFFAELAKGLNKPQSKTEEVKVILDKISVIYNAKIAEDKKKDGTAKKPASKQKPAIRMGKGIDNNAKNNNTQMIGELVGSDDEEYDDEDYGAEGSKREAEGDYDFM